VKKSELTKQRILEAAETEFAAKGIYGARVDHIAESAKVNKRMIYEYFGSKEQLYTKVLSVVYSRITECEKELLEDNVDCVQVIRNIITMYFEFLNGDQNFVKLIMWENLNEARYIKANNLPMIKDYAIHAARRVLERGVEQGVFRQDIDIEEIILSLNMFTFSYFSNIHTISQVMKIDFKKPEQIQKRIDHVTNMILSFIAAK
jgi:AcrR family transcriptional regulator